MSKVSMFTVDPDTTLREAMEAIDENGAGIVLAVDNDNTLLGTVTDGDIRRAILDGRPLDEKIGSPLREGNLGETHPYTATLETPEMEMRRRMEEHGIRQLPIIDQDDRLQDIVLLSDVAEVEPLPVTAVVMAGGFGTRLGSLTDEVPKPMLPVGDKPLLERILDQLREAGIFDVVLTVHYKRQQIQEHFGDGTDYGVDITYIEEEEPRGTAGSLAELAEIDETLLVMNGDILTELNPRSLYEFHEEQDATATVAVNEHEIEVPYGVVDTEGVTVTGLREKPVIRRFVNAGIYMLEPELTERIPPEEKASMTDLVEDLLGEQRVVSFPIREYWRDIGEPEDYENAQEDIEDGLGDN